MATRLTKYEKAVRIMDKRFGKAKPSAVIDQIADKADTTRYTASNYYYLIKGRMEKPKRKKAA